MTVTIRRFKIRGIDEENQVIAFDPKLHGKITGSRFAAVIGKDPYETEFEAACLISRLISKYEPTKYTEAGNVIEPKIRNYVRDNGDELLGKILGSDNISVEDPIPSKECNYDHFGNERVFGGMVDGYITSNGKRSAILEIKTASSRDAWLDENGNFTRAPEKYIMQASLYAILSGLQKIVFAVGFPKEDEYDHPDTFIPGPDNFNYVVMDRMDLSQEMKMAEVWYDEHILGGVTPVWGDEDSELIGEFTTFNAEILPDSMMKLIREYASEYDSGKDLSEYEAKIKHILENTTKNGIKRTVYEQNGLRFEYDLDSDSLLISKISC